MTQLSLDVQTLQPCPVRTKPFAQRLPGCSNLHSHLSRVLSKALHAPSRVLSLNFSAQQLLSHQERLSRVRRNSARYNSWLPTSVPSNTSRKLRSLCYSSDPRHDSHRNTALSLSLFGQKPVLQTCTAANIRSAAFVTSLQMA